jgi:hypothetical protein
MTEPIFDGPPDAETVKQPRYFNLFEVVNHRFMSEFGELPPSYSYEPSIEYVLADLPAEVYLIVRWRDEETDDNVTNFSFIYMTEHDGIFGYLVPLDLDGEPVAENTYPLDHGSTQELNNLRKATAQEIAPSN